MPPTSILITSASGNIGRALIPHLLASTPNTTRLILPTSSPTRLLASLPPKTDTTRLTVPEGPLSDPLWLEQTTKTHAVATAFLNLGGPDELPATLNALDAFARAGVKHVVYLSAAGDFTSPAGTAATLKAYRSASVVVKIAVEQALLHGEWPFTWTVVGPALFFENDVRTPELLLGDGWMPEPLGEKGVSRVSCMDVARVVARGIEDGGERLGGRKVNVGSLRRFSGTETGGFWTRALGREKGDEGGLEAYEGSWGEVVPGVAGRALGRDLSLMARGWVEGGFGFGEDEYLFLRDVLGKEVDDYEEWVMETGRKMREGGK